MNVTGKYRRVNLSEAALREKGLLQCDEAGVWMVKGNFPDGSTAKRLDHDDGQPFIRLEHKHPVPDFLGESLATQAA